MKILDHTIASSKWKCPICNTNKEGMVTLVKLDSTGKSGLTQKIIVHIDCIDLTLYKSDKVIFLSQDLRTDTLI